MKILETFLKVQTLPFLTIYVKSRNTFLVTPYIDLKEKQKSGISIYIWREFDELVAGR